MSCRMDEMMRGQRGWRELAILGDKIDKVSGVIEGFIWSPKAGDVNSREDNENFDDWLQEEVSMPTDIYFLCSCNGSGTLVSIITHCCMPMEAIYYCEEY